MAYLPLSTANLPDPVIDPAQGASPEDYFNTVLYTGTIVAQSITGVGFQPDLTWLKSRSSAYNHVLNDSIRGTEKWLISDTTDAELSASGFGVTSFDNDGFTLGLGTSFNNSGTTYVAWNWKANGSGVTNTDGSITSTVSANTTSGFSIVSYTGTGSAATVGHGLADTPDMVIVKNRSAADGWLVWHQGLSSGTSYLLLHSTNAQASNSAYFNGAPTSTYFNVGTSTNTNGSGNNLIAYCFAEKEGFSKFGSYEGNASSNGPFIYCGFRPAWLMVKNIDYGSTSSDWVIHDNKRNAYNLADHHLEANTSNAEDGDARPIDVDFLSNGFKIRTDGSYYENNNTQTYIYMAFAENPFKYSNAR